MRKKKYGLQISNIWCCQPNTSWAPYTCVYSVQSYWYKYRKFFSVKERMYRCLLVIKNKYCCEMHSTHAYYCWAQSLLAYLLFFRFPFLLNDCCGETGNAFSGMLVYVCQHVVFDTLTCFRRLIIMHLYVIIYWTTLKTKVIRLNTMSRQLEGAQYPTHIISLHFKHDLSTEL